MNISGESALQNVLTNAGTVTMTGAANLAVYNNSSTYRGGVYNLAGGALGHPDQREHHVNTGYGNEFFNNAGTFRKSGGSRHRHYCGRISPIPAR